MFDIIIALIILALCVITIIGWFSYLRSDEFKTVSIYCDCSETRPVVDPLRHDDDCRYRLLFTAGADNSKRYDELERARKLRRKGNR